MGNRLAELRASTSSLLQGLSAEQWSDADVRAPSLLPGWSRGHVLTHLARNADATVSTVRGALRGESVPRYPNGPRGRDADIEVGAGCPSDALIADVVESAGAMDEAFAAVDAVGGWALPCDDRSTGEYVLARWREVEIHRVDLGGSYGPRDWPAAFVSYLLPELAESFGDRTLVALRIQVEAAGSVSADLPGTVWTGGPDGGATGATEATEVIEVSGPDWALLAWLLGRPGATAGALSCTPTLERWT